jgi:hypothetical protein
MRQTSTLVRSEAVLVFQPPASSQFNRGPLLLCFRDLRTPLCSQTRRGDCFQQTKCDLLRLSELLS